jgi:DNA repair protein RadC
VSVTAARRCRDAELRADRRYLYLLTGSVGETVTDLSQRLLAQHGGLRGLGDAKSVRLIAALELERRLAALPPEDVANLLSIEMAALKQEQLWVVLLDTKHRILGTRTVSQSAAQIST